MGKKKRRTALGSMKGPQEERGFTVVNEKGKRVYLASDPEGVTVEEAQRLSDGLAAETRVVPVAEVRVG